MATITFEDATVTTAGTAPSIDSTGSGVVARTLLAETNLTLTQARIAVIGANGSGKSTLVRLINGLVRPTSGRVLIDGLDLTRNAAVVRRRVGFCFTDPAAQLVMPTAVEDIELSLRHRIRGREPRRAAALAVLRRYGLEELAHQSVHSLSGGQRQLLALASVLATHPTILLADEPSTLLDLANTRRVEQILFSVAAQLVLVTHDLSMAARCERVLVLDRGHIVADGPQQHALAAYRQLATQHDHRWGLSESDSAQQRPSRPDLVASDTAMPGAP
jgi:biotin transport system ATP-binding protein